MSVRTIFGDYEAYNLPDVSSATPNQVMTYLGDGELGWTSTGAAGDVLGTANQITASPNVPAPGDVTLSLPNAVIVPGSITNAGTNVVYGGRTLPGAGITNNVIVGKATAVANLAAGAVNNIIITDNQGFDNLTTGTKNIIIGDGLRVSPTTSDMICIGRQNNATSTAASNNMICIGNNAIDGVNVCTNSIILGTNASVTGANPSRSGSVFIGHNDIANPFVPSGPTGSAAQTIAIGYKAGSLNTDADGAILIGSKSQGAHSRLNSIIIGNGATVASDQTNLTQIGSDTHTSSSFVGSNSSVVFANQTNSASPLVSFNDFSKAENTISLPNKNAPPVTNGVYALNFNSTTPGTDPWTTTWFKLVETSGPVAYEFRNTANAVAMASLNLTFTKFFSSYVIVNVGAITTTSLALGNLPFLNKTAATDLSAYAPNDVNQIAGTVEFLEPDQGSNKTGLLAFAIMSQFVTTPGRIAFNAGTPIGSPSGSPAIWVSSAAGATGANSAYAFNLQYSI